MAPSSDRHLSAPAAPPSVGQGASPLLYDLRGVEVAFENRRILGPLDLQIRAGDFLGILGPNGSGKTTLLRTLTGALRPNRGDVELLGRPAADYHPLEVARLVGVVPQQFTLDFGFTVAEMVAMGRYAQSGHRPAFPPRLRGRSTTSRQLHALSTTSPRLQGRPMTGALRDDDIVTEVLSQTGLTELASRPVTRLSGGERQRALIAQTLAQETPVLLLDEPLNNLDLNHQLEIMQLLRGLHEAGRTIAVILHDLNMAAQYCDRLLLLEEGRIAAEGAPQVVLDPRLILEVFKVRVTVHHHGARPYLTPVWSRDQHLPSDRAAPRVHVVAGGGAATPLIEELVARGFAPSLGVVSVFDTDYLTAERYELEVVSAPPFQAFPPDAIQQMETLLGESEALVVAPVFFGSGNLELLNLVLHALEQGHPVVFLDPDSCAQRDLTGGEAVALTQAALARGARAAPTVDEVVRLLDQLVVGRTQPGNPG